MVPKKNLLIIKQKPNNCQKYAPCLGILRKSWEKCKDPRGLVQDFGPQLRYTVVNNGIDRPDQSR